MYRNILVPLDGSSLAEVILPYAEDVAGRLNVNMHILHVCSSAESAFMCESYVRHAAEIARKESREIQSKTGAKPTVEAVTQVTTGQPAEEILRYAEGHEIDFILMSTHGRSGIGRWVLGSVTHKVLSASGVPVWLVRAGTETGTPNREDFHILAPLDGSPAAESVVPHLEALAGQRASRHVKVTLLNVCEPPDLLADYPEARMPHTWDEHVKMSSASTTRVCMDSLGKARERLEQAGVRVESDARLGNPARVIIDYQQGGGFDLIVLSAHGRSGPSPWQFGSITEKVLYGAATPVFMVRPPATKAL